jgi:5'-3' exonuclease
MGYQVILVDANSVGYAAHSATKLTAAGIETQAIYGFLHTLYKLKVRNPSARISVLWDGRSMRRYAIHPGYKAGRDDTVEKVKMRAAYDAQKPYLRAMLSDLAVAQLHYADLEADDLAGHYAQKLKARPEVSVLLLTGDFDWLQLVRENVTWYDARRDLTITPKNMLSQTGYASPYALLEGKCLVGDTSDKIKGVGGIGEKGAPEFLAEFGSVMRFWKMVDAGEFKPVKKAQCGLASPAGRALFKRNLALMQLLNVPTPDPSQRLSYGCVFNPDSFKQRCEELNFLSILGKFKDFTAPFAPKEPA